MTTQRIAIIDDDPFVVAYLTKAFRERLPTTEIVSVTEPVAPFGFDVYVVDREFYGQNLGRNVIRRIRKIEPHSQILVYSAHLDREFLRGLMREGCSGAFDKGSLEELQSMIGLVEDFLNDGQRTTDRVHGLGNTVVAIMNLIREWNLRLNTRSNPAEQRDENVSQ